jgi:uncharacterized repeat protein (TIGR01451 family)
MFLSAAVLNGQVSVLTWHNDNARTGQNLQETILTPANVKSATFGRLATLSVDGKVDAQPLYVPAVTIPNQGVHNVLYVATENDSLYAFDADSFAQLLHVSLLGASEVPSNDGCSQITPVSGITATPAIDLQAGSHGVIYAIAQSKDASGNYHHRLHALDLTTLTEQFGGPKEIQASFPGSGAENTFNPTVHVERPALLISNGVVYTSWGSHCDGGSYAGWLLSYNETTLAQAGVLSLVPNGNDGGIWGAGSGPAVDADGNVFLLTGNGTFDTTLNSSGLPSQGDFGNAFVKIPTSGALSVADYFTMDNTVSESNGDVDLGSGGLLLLPPLENGQGTLVSLVVGAGKDSNIYVLDRTNLGGFHPGMDSIYQQMSGALPSGAWSSPAWFNGTLYYGGVSDYLKAFTFTNGLFSLASHSANTFLYPGATPSISANGTANGIAWVVENQATAVLHAFNANNVATELYNSNQAAGGRDQFGAGNKFIVPTIANGKVYVGTTSGVGVFGLLAGNPAPAISIVKTHAGSFTQGQLAATYTVTVSNAAGAAPTSGTVTVTDTLPAGLTLSSMGGTGWSCAGNTCTRSDVLNPGASYPAITVTVNVGASASSPQVNSVSVLGGGSASASATDSTIIQAATAATVSAVSVAPNSGSGLQQTFALEYADSLGAADLATVWVWFTANFSSGSAANSCMVYYTRATNQLFFLNDAGTAWSSPVAPGTAVTLSNSQCSINVGTASVTPSATNLTLNLPVTFTPAYTGLKSTYMYAAGSNANSGWQALGSWTVPASEVVSAVSVAPNSGSGLQQTFALNYADSLGATDLATVWVWFTANFSSGSAADSCMVYYARAANQLYFLNDAGTAWSTPVAPGAAVTLSNSQCSLNVAAASVTPSGTDLTLSLPVTFTPAYAGAKSTYMYAAGSSANSGWQALGTWTVPASEVVSAASVAPSSGSGLQQTFALNYADSLGATDLATVWVWFTANFSSGSAANSCMVYYARAANQLYVLNDAGTVWSSPVAPGAAVTLSNTQCSLNVAAASVTPSGTNLTLSLPVTFTPGYAGAKNTYMYAAGSSANSGWQALGTWTIPATTEVVSAVSVAPNSGSGLQQTFALNYADSLGATDLTTVWVWFTANFSSGSAANSCMVYYARAANQLYFLNDAGTAWSPPVAPGAAVTLSNSQCSINVAAASVTPSGTNLTLSLPVTFMPPYAGAKSTYMYAAGSTANSGWQALGTWTVPGSEVVSAVSVAPNSGSGLQQTFALEYADSLGATDLATVWVWFTANFSSGSAANSCMIYYATATNQLYFLNDAGTAWSSPAAPGTAVTLSNSQCSINVAAASVTPSGTNLTLNLPVTFTAAYAGAQSTYMYAAGSTANSGWQALGSWTP